MRNLFAGSERYICSVTGFRKQKTGRAFKNSIDNIFSFTGIFVAVFSITVAVYYLKNPEFHVL